MSFSDIVAIGSIIIGVILCIVIIHNEKKKRKHLQDEINELRKSIEQDETKADIEIRIKKLKDMAESVVDEINDNTEEKLNTLSNKKIMEFEEYANQLLEKIEINHKEVMFLYDMLNDKVDDVKKIVAELDNKKLEVTELEIANNKVISKDSSVEDINNKVNDIDIEKEFVELFNSCMDRGKEVDLEDAYEQDIEEISLASVLEEQRAMENKEHTQIKFESFESVKDEKKDSDLNNYQRRNEQIIKLYSLGYSTVDISKKLGIGTGEVALINNLYHDKMVVAD